MDKKKIIVVGAGPGGLTAGMILASRGFDVEIFERAGRVGGRNAELKAGPYSFDTGPTFLMMKFILDEMFAEAGKNSSDYLEFIRLDPMYRLMFPDFNMDVTQDQEKMKAEIARLFPGQEAGYDRFMAAEGRRFEKIYACLQRDYPNVGRYISKAIVEALPYVPWGRTVMDVLKKYFSSEQLRLAFSFQSKYLGMSPWDCPGIFTMLPFIEHRWGVYHVRGGLCRISEAMAKVTEQAGGRIRLNAPVRQVLLEDGRASGVELEDGSRHLADSVVINADFAYAMSHLFRPGTLRKYSPSKLAARDYSCSTFMLYLGVDKIYRELPHHTIVFSSDYKKFLQEIFRDMVISQDPSVYVRNSSINDPSVAPPGHSNIYILVPAPNNKSGLDWQREKNSYRDRILEMLEKRTPLSGLRQHIREERIITPRDWEKDANVYLGATFNLAHSMSQMLYFRPHNRFEEVKNLFLVGGGTHPGSGLPTIYESGRISANLISSDFGLPCAPAPSLAQSLRRAGLA